MISDPSILLSAFMLGFMGSGHCLGMCGGLASALGLNTQTNTPNQSTSLILGYNFGRIISYCIAGLIVGSLGFWLSKQLALLDALRYLAGAMLILMGLYLGQWFSGILWAEKMGKLIWPYLQPLSKRFIPIKTATDAIMVGLVWGWLPCGLVYSALIWASLEANFIGSASIMLAFGLGTLPSMLASGMFAEKIANLLRQKTFRAIAGILMIGFGVWTMPAVHRYAMQMIG